MRPVHCGRNIRTPSAQKYANTHAYGCARVRACSSVWTLIEIGVTWSTLCTKHSIDSIRKRWNWRDARAHKKHTHSWMRHLTLYARDRRRSQRPSVWYVKCLSRNATEKKRQHIPMQQNTTTKNGSAVWYMIKILNESRAVAMCALCNHIVWRCTRLICNICVCMRHRSNSIEATQQCPMLSQ